MILHDISDNSELVKVSSATLGSEWFLECDGDAGDMISVPCGSEDHVAKPQTDQILHHLFTQIVIDSKTYNI